MQNATLSGKQKMGGRFNQIDSLDHGLGAPLRSFHLGTRDLGGEVGLVVGV